MDRVFSVDEISDHFWSPPPIRLSSSTTTNQEDSKMNRSSSEWAFQRFLQEAVSASQTSPPSSSSKLDGVSAGTNDVVQINDQNCLNHHPLPSTTTTTTTTTSFNTPPNVPIDSDEYQAFLKSRLNLACAAVALSRASLVKPQDSAALADSGSQASNTSQLGSHAPSKGSGFDLSGAQDKDVGGPLGIPSLPAMQKKSGVQLRQTTSGSSRELSDDDELEEETETTANMDPGDAKRVRRMLSNRESARRSRRRKQAHLTELETQRLTDISQKYNEAAVDNRVLKADIETMRAKVTMAEETVKRVTGFNPLYQPMSEISTMGMPSFDGSPSDASGDASVPVKDDPKQHFYQPASTKPVLTNDPRINNGLADISSVENVQQNPAAVAGNKMGRTASLQRVASLEHLQKRIRGGVSPCGPLSQCNGEQ